MKNLYKIGMLAVAALAFASCNKEVDTPVAKGTHVVTVKATKDFDTKTAIVEEANQASYIWTDGDEDYFHVYENGIEANKVTMSVDDDGLATFTVEFDDTDATSFEYTARYFKEESNKNNPLIIADQKPTLTSFDPSADVLIAQSQTKDAPATELQFALRRVVSINKMTLKGLVAGEKISSVELASTDKSFSAHYVVSSDSYSANGKKLTFDYSKLNAVVGSDGTFPVFFVSAPVEDATFSVKVTTDQNVYSRDDFTSKLTLVVGQVKRFGIKLGDYGTPISTGKTYTLVESEDDLFDGASYIIVGSKEGEFKAAAEQTANNRAAASVSVETDGSIIIDNTSSVHSFTLGETSNGYTLWDNDKTSGYLYAAGAAASKQNYMRSSVDLIDNAYWTITFANGVTSIVSVHNDKTPYMQYNSSNGLFSCYNTASQSPVSLYVDKSTCVELADPELSFNGDATINVAWANIADFTAPTLNNPHNVTVTYSSSNSNVATVDAATGEIEFVGDGTTVITASSAKTDVYKAGAAQYTLVVSGAPVPHAFTTVAELNALASTTGEYFGSLTNAVISFVPDAKNAIIKDATGSVLVFKDDHGYKQGQTFTGDLTVTLTKFNNASEITAIDAKFTGAGAVVNPESVTLADLDGNFATWQNAYVVVEDLEVVSTSGKNINVKNGDKSYVVYSSKADATCVKGDIIKATGTIGQYSNKDQVKAWTVDDIVITQQHPIASHAITFTQPSTGGTFTVKVGEEEIESGDEVEEGKVVTLSATAANGYLFNGWTVTGATISGNTATETFTVGVSDVTISAAFRPSSIDSVVYTLDGTITGGSSGYDSASDIKQNSISWKVMGNTTMSPWRIGGKSLTNVDRTVYSVDKLEYNISKIKITHGAASNITVNSMTVIVASNADFSTVVSTLTPTFSANGAVTVERPSGADWSNCYYKIVYNVSVSGNSNRFIEFKEMEFTGK